MYPPFLCKIKLDIISEDETMLASKVGFRVGHILEGIHESNRDIRLEIVYGVHIVADSYDKRGKSFKHVTRDQFDKWHKNRSVTKFSDFDPDILVKIQFVGCRAIGSLRTLSQLLRTRRVAGVAEVTYPDETFLLNHWAVSGDAHLLGINVDISTGEIVSGYLPSGSENNIHVFDSVLFTQQVQRQTFTELATHFGRNLESCAAILSRLRHLDSDQLGALIYLIIKTGAKSVKIEDANTAIDLQINNARLFEFDVELTDGPMSGATFSGTDVLFTVFVYLLAFDGQLAARSAITSIISHSSFSDENAITSLSGMAYGNLSKISPSTLRMWIDMIIRAHTIFERILVDSDEDSDDDVQNYNLFDGKTTLRSRTWINGHLIDNPSRKTDSYDWKVKAYEYNSFSRQNRELIPEINATSCLVDLNLAYYLKIENTKILGVESIDTLALGVFHKHKGILDREKVAIEEAQMRYWVSLNTRSGSIKYETTGDSVEHTYTLSKEWIASMVGVVSIELDDRRILMTMNVNNLVGEPVIIREQSADDHTLTEIHKDSARAEFLRRFRSDGFELKCPEVFPQFQGCRIFLDRVDDCDVIIVEQGGLRKVLDLTLRSTFPIHPKKSVEDSLIESMNDGTGICVDADVELKRYFKRISRSSAIRLSYYLTNIQEHIELGFNLSNTKDDVETFWFLCAVCVQYPGALRRKNNVFFVKSGALMRSIAEKITKLTSSESHTWDLEDAATNIPQIWPHQHIALEELLRENRRNDIIWYDVGSGKTRIVLEYMLRRIDAGYMCQYCLWALPGSAAPQIRREARRFGFCTKILSESNRFKLDPGVINIIQHQDLRLIKENLFNVFAPNMLFVNDEFHQTIKSNVCKTLLCIAHRTISLSGTVLVDPKTKDSWLKYLRYCVSFDLNEENFYVALSAAIARKLPTSVEVIRRTVNVVRRPGESEDPDKLVDRAMFEDAIRYIQSGLGVFVVVRDLRTQKKFSRQFTDLDISSEMILENNAVSYEPILEPDPRGAGYIATNSNLPQAVITTPEHCMGYCMNRYKIMLTHVISESETIRQQLEGRINRHNNDAKVICVRTYVA